MPRRIKSRRKVFVARTIDNAALDRLRAEASVTVWNDPMPPSRKALLAALTDADAILSMITDKIDASVIAHAPRIRVISNLGAGLDNNHLQAATRTGIGVGHTPRGLTDATPDLTFLLMLAAAHRIPEADRYWRV